jgi:hypothetical protein
MPNSGRCFRMIGLVFLCVLMGITGVVIAGDLDEALHEAAAKGNNKKIQSLLNKGVDINTEDVNGRTALYKAVENGHSDTVRLLLKAGSDPIKPPYFEKLFYSAAAEGNLDKIQALLEAGVRQMVENGSVAAPYLELISSDIRKLQKKLDHASAIGFRIYDFTAFRHVHEPKGGVVIYPYTDLVIKLRLSGKADGSHRYKWLDSWQPFSEKEIKKMTEKGYRLFGTVLVEPVYHTGRFSGEEIYVGIFEKTSP